MTKLTIRTDTPNAVWQAHRPNCQHLNMAGDSATFDIDIITTLTQDAVEAELDAMGHEDTAVIMAPCTSDFR